MAEIKRKVQPVEVNYICDKCEHGMMEKTGLADEESGDTLHKCMICGYQQSFKWVSYPHIDYIGEEEKL